MRVLAVDTTSNAASVALVEDNVLVGEFILNHKKTHSQEILPMIDEVLRRAGWRTLLTIRRRCCLAI